MWRAACVSVGLGNWEAVTDRSVKQKRRYTGLLFHDLRRAGVRNLRKAGVDQTTGMLISGHKTPAVYRRYDIVNEADIRSAGEKLARFHEQEGRKLLENGDSYGDSGKAAPVN